MKKNLFAFCFLLFASQFTLGEFIVPLLPSTPVYDEVGILSAGEKSQLEQQILTLEKETSHQIGIAIIKSLQGRTVEEVGITIARSWGIGQKGVDNGLLFLVVPDEREVRIEVGRGLEGVVTDLMSKRVIDENLLPNFRNNAYGKGLAEAIERITPILRGETVVLPEPPKDIFAILISLVVWLTFGGFFLGSAIFEKSKAWWPGLVLGAFLGGIVMWVAVGTLVMIIIGVVCSSIILGGLDFLFSTGVIKAIKSRPNGGRWGGGGFGGFGGSSGGGGWGGFGGGGFGGGGASGRW